MRLTTIAIPAALLMTALGTIHAFQRRYLSGERVSQQYEWEMQNPAQDPPDAHEKTEWAFARLRYPSYGRGGGRGFGRRGRGYSWATDANKADRQFIMGVRRLTRLHARSVEQVVDIDDPAIFDWPWLYAVEVGHWELSIEQAKRLRDYLDRGGFLMVDDFHGTYEWEVFYQSLARVFPDRPVVEIEDSHSIFHVLNDLEKRFQVPGRRYVYSGVTYEQDGYEPRWRAIMDDKGRIQVAICHNMDLGDAWEWADFPAYPEHFASLAYRIGVNYIIYAITH
jgi:hypothetical protein